MRAALQYAHAWKSEYCNMVEGACILTERRSTAERHAAQGGCCSQSTTRSSKSACACHQRVSCNNYTYCTALSRRSAKREGSFCYFDYVYTHNRPPAGSVVGERLTVAGLSGEPLNANAVKKRKAWEVLAPSLTIDAQHTACFKGQPISTSAGVCTADTVTDGRIS
eukprot:4817-Heterococcus_DN1.PRE.3